MIIQRKTSAYLCILEVGDQGWVLCLSNYKKHAQSLIDGTMKLTLNSLNNPQAYKKIRIDYIEKFTVNSPIRFVEKDNIVLTNGYVRVYAVKIDLTNFCLKTFIREWQNSNTLFCPINESGQDEAVSKLLKNYREHAYKSN